ncbi:MAG: glycosyltransferase family 39 protein [Anaerolineales bacterium]
MTSSQIPIYGLAVGGFVLLALLLIYFLSISRQLWRKQAIATGQNHLTDGFLARFSDLSASSAPEPAGLDAGEADRPAQVLNRKWLGILLLAVVIAIGAELSLIALLNNDGDANIQAPMLGFLIAGALFVLVCRKVEVISLPAPFKAILPEIRGPSVTLWFTNLGLSLVILSTIDVDLPNSTNYLVLGAWFVNILLFCWNVFQLAHVSLPSRDAVKEWWRAHRLEVLVLALIGLAALLIRTIGLETYPFAFANDEAEVGNEGLNILGGVRTAFFAIGWSGQPVLSFLPAAIAIKLFGNTAFAVRLIGALQGTLTVIFLYLLAREAFDRTTAVFAACLLTALPWEVHFSRLGVMNISDSFFSAGVLWLTYRALRRGKYLDYLAAGLMTGAAIYTYLGSRLAIAMAVGVIGYAALRQRDYLRTHFRHLAILILAFLIVASPMMLSFSHHIDEFLGRANETGLLANGKLARDAADAGMSPLDFLIRQVRVSTTVYIATPAGDNFFGSSKPYLNWWTAIFLVLGMAYAFWHIKQVRYIMLVGWFWAPLLLGSALTAGPPNHQRMLGAAPALALIVALGLWKLAQAFQLTFPRLSMRWLLVICMAIVAFTAWQDLDFYFVGDYRTNHEFEIAGNEISYEVGLRAGALGPNYRLFLIGEADVFAIFADFHYLAPYTDIEDFNTVNPETIANLPRDRGILFVAIPAKVDELKKVVQQLPGGTWTAVPRVTQEGVSYYSYLLPGPSTTP